MLYQLLRPLLFRCDAEDAHNFAMSTAAVVSRHRVVASLVRSLAGSGYRPVDVAGLTFPNPIGLAAGMDKNAIAPLAWWALGFGFMELGTVTPRPQAGKPRPRMFRQVGRAAIVNRMGFNNDGALAVAKRLAEQKTAGLRPNFPLGISVGKNADTSADDAAHDYAMAASTLAPFADYLAINISSPNTTGLRDLQTSVEVAKLIESVRSAAPNKPVFVKIAPELEGDSLRGVLDACADAGASGVIATNTLATHGKNGLPEGGLSGRPLREISRRQVAVVRKCLDHRLAIIGCGGVEDVDSAQSMLDAGADLVQLYTALVYRGPFLPGKIVRGLRSESGR